jgi:hypothetical protein
MSITRGRPECLKPFLIENYPTIDFSDTNFVALSMENMTVDNSKIVEKLIPIDIVYRLCKSYNSKRIVIDDWFCDNIVAQSLNDISVFACDALYGCGPYGFGISFGFIKGALAHYKKSNFSFCAVHIINSEGSTKGVWARNDFKNSDLEPFLRAFLKNVQWRFTCEEMGKIITHEKYGLASCPPTKNILSLCDDRINGIILSGRQLNK